MAASNNTPSMWQSLEILNSPAQWTSQALSSIPQISLPSFNQSTHTSSVLSLSPLTLATGITTMAVTATALRSLFKMASWRTSLRVNKTNAPAPGPPPLPLLGNMLSLRSGYYETLYDYVDQPASVFWVLSTPFVVINDEQGLRSVLGGSGGLYAKPKYFGYRSRALKTAVKEQREKVAKESIEYLDDGDVSRVALEGMVKDSLSTIQTSMEVLLMKLVAASGEPSEENEESVSAIRKAIVALNLQVLFGMKPGSEKAEDVSRISEMIGFAGSEFARRMVNPLRVFFDLLGNVRYVRDVSGLIGLGRRLCKLLDDTADAIGNKVAPGTEFVTGSTSGLSWVHAWVGKVGKIGKLGKVVGLLMASTQTVPLTAAWMLHLVGNNEDVLRQLREELHDRGVTESGQVCYANLEEFVYADAVVKEILRLYPPFPLIQREAQESAVLCGIRIPKGTPVYVVPWLVHRNPRYWKDADKFIPERFFENRSHGDAPSDWVYLPFGRGARMCAGSKLAMTELKILLICAVLGYEWESKFSEEGRDGKFPALGMVPQGLEVNMRMKI